MSEAPLVSVVMSVYNGAAALPESLSSVLEQRDCNLEIIVVDDGSTDESARILDAFAERDRRLLVIHQQNTGLTQALILGCARARGEFIARQDAGDISLPGRFAAQMAFLHGHPHAVMVCSAVQFCGPMDEPLYVLARPMGALDTGLRALSLDQLCGPPHHGATMFRRDAYERAGGYRAAFAVAQDLDLWLRMIEQGQCLGMVEVFYRARLEMGSISSRRREEQIRMLKLALECARVRALGADDRQLLAAAVAVRQPKRPVSARERARFHYFVGSCLRASNPLLARVYFGKALRDNPLHVKALLHWMMI